MDDGFSKCPEKIFRGEKKCHFSGAGPASAFNFQKNDRRRRPHHVSMICVKYDFILNHLSWDLHPPDDDDGDCTMI